MDLGPSRVQRVEVKWLFGDYSEKNLVRGVKLLEVGALELVGITRRQVLGVGITETKLV